MSAVHPELANEKESHPSPLSRCEHAQAKSVQTQGQGHVVCQDCAQQSHKAEGQGCALLHGGTWAAAGLTLTYSGA